MKKLLAILFICLLVGALPPYIGAAVSGDLFDNLPSSGELTISGETDCEYRSMREALNDLGM